MKQLRTHTLAACATALAAFVAAPATAQSVPSGLESSTPTTLTASGYSSAPTTSIQPRLRPWWLFQNGNAGYTSAENDVPATTPIPAPTQNRVTRFEGNFNQALIGVYR